MAFFFTRNFSHNFAYARIGPTHERLNCRLISVIIVTIAVIFILHCGILFFFVFRSRRCQCCAFEAIWHNECSLQVANRRHHIPRHLGYARGVARLCRERSALCRRTIKRVFASQRMRFAIEFHFTQFIANIIGPFRDQIKLQYIEFCRKKIMYTFFFFFFKNPYLIIKSIV